MQVLLADSEMEEIRQIARRHQMTVGEWVRQALRAARCQAASGDPRLKLRAVRKAARHSFPTAEIPQMLAEIERGYQE